MKEQNRKISRKLIVGVLAIFLYFAVLTCISYQRASEEFRIDKNAQQLIGYQDFIVMNGNEGERVEPDGLVFNSSDGSAKVFAARVNLAELRTISVQFTVDCPKEYAGTTLHVDLYDGEAYDAPEQEFSVVLAPGVNQINEVLDKGENAPEEAWLRIFTLEPAGYSIHNLKVYPIAFHSNRLYAVLLVFLLVFFVLIAMAYIGAKVKKAQRK